MPKPEEYLEIITDIINKYGVRGLTMDQIAAKMGVTKRTLYNNFGTKEELLKSIIDYKFLKIRDIILELASHPTRNAIQIHLSVMNSAVQQKDESSCIFVQSLHDNHPDLFDYMTQKSQRLMNEFFALNIPRGRTEGLYRNDFDIDIVSTFAHGALNSFLENMLHQNGNVFDKEKIQRQVVTLLLRGMVTSEGAKVLDQEL